MGIVIKRATLEDIDMLVEWRTEVLREVFSLPQNSPMEELSRENRRYYQKALQMDDHAVCFACLESAVIGCGGLCLYEEMPSPDNPTGKCAYLMNIYTRPRFRGQGAGQAVIDWLIGEAKRRGAAKIYLEASEAGKHLYQEKGFVPMQGMMKLPADGV